MPEQLTITVTAGGDDAEARAFIAAVRDTIEILEDLGREHGNGNKIVWRIVGMKKESPPRITIASHASFAIVALFLNGMQAVDSGPAMPFAAPAMQKVQRLGRRLQGEIDSLVYESPQLPTVAPTSQIVRHAEEALGEKFYWAPSTLEGKLELVNIHGKLRFSIFDEIDGSEIKCQFPEHLLDNVKFCIAKRVSVFGNVKRDRSEDRPRNIVVETIESLDDVLPAPKTFGEMDAIDISGGLSSEEYVRRLRNE